MQTLNEMRAEKYNLTVSPGRLAPASALTDKESTCKFLAYDRYLIMDNKYSGSGFANPVILE